MASQTVISLDEYMRTSFEGPDREFVDGEVLERNMEQLLHGIAQANFVPAFGPYRAAGLRVITEIRVRLRERLIRVPDVGVFEGKPTEDVPSTPCLVAIEILSPDDRLGATRARLQEYRDWGVRHAWIVDPDNRIFYVLDDAGFHDVPQLTVPAYGIVIQPADIFN